jgi:hypothetical protein
MKHYLATGVAAALAFGALQVAAAADATATGTTSEAAVVPGPTAVATPEDELRSTVVNILDALVQKGLLTREQARELVADAKAKAAVEAQQRATQAVAGEAAVEKDAVRVTYVPQIVKDQLATEVGAQVRKDVAAQVVQQAKSERWGVPGALPEWIRNLSVYGDVRVRAEDAIYAKDNTRNFYLNFAAVNSVGGISKAGIGGLLNVSQDRPRLIGRLRFGGLVQLGDTLRADFRLASGNPSNAISTNQTLGVYGARWQLGVDKAALLWNPHSSSWREEVDVRAGRFDNPFATYNELIWDQDLMFEGVSATWDWNRVRGWNERTSRWLFATAGAFPLQEIELTAKDKWLYGAQLGTEVPFSYDSRLRIAAGLFNYANVTGALNAPDSKLLDYTAPAALQKGNTLFDIRNDVDPSTNLFALAGKYRLITGLMQFDALAFGDNHVVVSGEFVKNIGWKTADVLARTGVSIAAHTSGYEVGVTVGRPRVSKLGEWRAGLSYRRLERDAVLDAFTDSDFHLGGTDAEGYILSFDYGLGRSAFTRFRYLSANAIDGPPLGIDVAQFDLVGQF